MRGLDDDIWRATGGNFDLGTLAGLAFLGAGAVEVGVTRKLPMPPWFNLAWWAFRTLVIFESEEANATRGKDTTADDAPAARDAPEDSGAS
ncbi:MAG: hypothetical protein AB7V27_19020 [Candidatus Binatia bacterium]